MLGDVDPFYHMNVTYTATLYPGVAAWRSAPFVTTALTARSRRCSGQMRRSL